jgi:hypothetical protein
MYILTYPNIKGEYLSDEDFINAPKKTLKFKTEESALKHFLDIHIGGCYDPQNGNLFIHEYEERPIGTLLKK